MSKILNEMKWEEFIDEQSRSIADKIEGMNAHDRIMTFLSLSGRVQSEVFTLLEKDQKADLLKKLGNKEIAQVLENMPPDDRTELFEDFPDLLIKDIINLLSAEERKIALTLIGYDENSVGRLMTPHYIQSKQNRTVKETLYYIKRYGTKAETLNFIYVVDKNQRLIDDIKIGHLLMAETDTELKNLMDFQFIALKTRQSREEAISTFKKYDRAALPVVSEKGILVGIVTFDDMFDEIEKQNTEDIQKFGGVETLDLPYADTTLIKMVRKRAGWLVILFVSEMFTASAMAYYEDELARAVVLTLFVPLIISSGGNSGSQAATLIIRAMALNEIGLRDWWLVMRKEILSGLFLGIILGIIGFLRIFFWQALGFYHYGVHWIFIGLAVAFSLVGVVLWGTLSGSMIPFILKKIKLDPATSSAPFVATVVDVTGLIIYFTIATLILSGKLL